MKKEVIIKKTPLTIIIETVLGTALWTYIIYYFASDFLTFFNNVVEKIGPGQTAMVFCPIILIIMGIVKIGEYVIHKNVPEETKKETKKTVKKTTKNAKK